MSDISDDSDVDNDVPTMDFASFYGIQMSENDKDDDDNESYSNIDNNSTYSPRNSLNSESPFAFQSSSSPSSLPIENKTTTNASSSSSNTSNLNSNHFNASKYVEDLMSSHRAEELQSRGSKMMHEIRTLDGDMQMLVYENYNKFISATETIKRMKSNVIGMEDDMSKVEQKMKLCGKLKN